MIRLRRVLVERTAAVSRRQRNVETRVEARDEAEAALRI
jgi:hypothetical protein